MEVRNEEGGAVFMPSVDDVFMYAKHLETGWLTCGRAYKSGRGLSILEVFFVQ